MTTTAPNITSTAREALTQAEGDWALAAQIMREWVEEDAELREALTEPLLAKAIWAAISSCARTDRTKFHAHATATHADRTTTDDGLTLLANDHFDSLLLFPLRGGKPLGQATREEVLESAEFYLAQAKTNAIRGRWLNAVAARMNESKTVLQHKKQLNDEVLRQLLAAAEAAPATLDTVTVPVERVAA